MGPRTVLVLTWSIERFIDVDPIADFRVTAGTPFYS